MRFSELREKEVINICGCERLGFVCDLEFDECNGCIRKIIVPGPCKCWGLLGYESEYVIDFCCIRKIGIDIILVDINIEETLVKCK